MRRLLMAMAVVALLGAGACGNGKGTEYGKAIGDGAATPIHDVLARAKELDGKEVRVEGTVTDVCAKRGCWIEIGDDAGTDTILFKVQDGVMVFPMDAKGRRAVAVGTLRRVELSLEDTRAQMAEEAAEAGRAFDPATVTEPRVFIRLDGIGARIAQGT